jgi:hypothetical protein
MSKTQSAIPPSGIQTEVPYQGTELELFAKATNWKKYLASKLRPYINGNVIEVGAGFGSSTKYLCHGGQAKWLCLDPDPSFARHLEQRIASGDLPAACQARCGVLADLVPEELADTILYIDVLEHIENDEDEMNTATAHLSPGGRTIVLSPAFNWLYSPFDKAIGHHRRYTTKDAKRLTVPHLVLQRIFFLDSVGLFASLANRILVKASTPSASQIRFWDRVMVPVSTYSDGIFGSAFGRTIVMVWQKT